MANILGAYDPVYYVNNALMWLSNSLGMAATVYRDPNFESVPERGTAGKMRRPGTFDATDVDVDTGGTTQDAASETVNISYDFWKEVKFKVTERDLVGTEERFITEHIGPAANAVANSMDASLAALYKYVPSYVVAASTPGLSDITAARAALFNQKVPLNDPNRYLMLSGAFEAAYLNIAAFNTSDGAGSAGVDTQINGFLNRKFGFGIYANQNTPSHTTGHMADTAGALNGNHAKGATTVAINALTDADTITPGDMFSIAGSTQYYSYVGTTTVTVASNAASLTISPPLQQAYSTGAVVTFYAPSTAATKVTNIAYHRNAFGLKMARLPDMANALGAKISTQVDPYSGLALRARLFYDGDKNSIKVSLDAMWAAVALDPRLAVRLREN